LVALIAVTASARLAPGGTSMVPTTVVPSALRISIG